MDTLSDQNNTKQCPYCAEMIRSEAIVCRFCGYDLRSGEPTRTQSPEQAHADAPVVQARSGVADGIKLGCGMFIVLPLLLIGGAILLLIILAGIGASTK